MEDFLKAMTDKIQLDILKKKEQLIIDRLAELGIKDDIKKEPKRRFKKFLCETQGQKSTYYYNDGSQQGLRLITIEVIFPLVGIDGDGKINAEIKYY